MEYSFNLGFITHSLVRGGAPIFLLEFIRSIQDEVGQIVVISEKDGPLRSNFDELNIPVRIMPRSGPLEIGLIWNLRSALREFQCDIVHLNTFSSYYKYGAIAACSLRRPVVWGIREDVTTRRCRKLHWWIKNLATCILPCSHEIAHSLYPQAIPGKLVVAHDGIPPLAKPVDAPNIHEELSIPNHCRIIGCVAALEKRKGIRELIQAFEQVLRTHDDVHLVCAGEDRSSGHQHLPMLTELIAKLGLSSKVHLVGDRTDILGWYPQFDLFVLPTYWEGISRVLLEAIQAQCPIITTRAGGNVELLIDQEGGVLVEPGDIQGLAKAIRHAFGNPEECREHAAFSLTKLNREFSLNSHRQQMLAGYSRLLQGEPF